jgi:catechol 2,3-dioxygenase-like lactoylglutathione lyase family enzyme
MIKGLAWLGVRTDRFDELERFMTDAMGLTVDHKNGEATVFKLDDGSKVEIFGPTDEEHRHFSTGPVAGFLVEDISSAREQLESAGAEFIGPIHEWEPTGETWTHFRAPDGNVYELTHRPK